MIKRYGITHAKKEYSSIRPKNFFLCIDGLKYKYLFFIINSQISYEKIEIFLFFV